MILPNFDIKTQKSVPFDGDSLSPSSLSSNPRPEMSLLDAICTRRTSRHYDDRKVDDETFKWLIKYSMEAPSACNEQKWKVILIDDPNIISELYWRGSASFIKNIKQCFVITYSNETDNIEWKDHIQSGAAFINTFSLLAHSIGIGTCWVGHLPNKREIQRILNIHRKYEPIALVSFGYYKTRVKMKPRKREADAVIFKNRFDPRGLSFSSDRKTFKRMILRYIYYKIPAVIRKKLKPYTTKYEKKFYYEITD